MDDSEFAEINSTSIKIFNKNKRTIRKPTKVSKINKNQASLMGHRHFMHKEIYEQRTIIQDMTCLLYTSPSPRDRQKSRMPSSA